jgi:acyl-CoA hydrolase
MPDTITELPIKQPVLRVMPMPSEVKVTEAVLTYVAINQHGEKRELPAAD